MVKLGNKYLCKKTNIGHDYDLGVEKGEWYKVIKFDVKVNGLHVGKSNQTIRYIQVNNNKSVFNFYFCINERNNISDYFWDYFYTEKELRKIKLNNIKK